MEGQILTSWGRIFPQIKDFSIKRNNNSKDENSTQLALLIVRASEANRRNRNWSHCHPFWIHSEREISPQRLRLSSTICHKCTATYVSYSTSSIIRQVISTCTRATVLHQQQHNEEKWIKVKLLDRLCTGRWIEFFSCFVHNSTTQVRISSKLESIHTITSHPTPQKD